MTRTMNPSAWAKRLAAVLGTSLLTLALVTPTTAAEAKPSTSKTNPSAEETFQTTPVGDEIFTLPKKMRPSNITVPLPASWKNKRVKVTWEWSGKREVSGDTPRWTETHPGVQEHPVSSYGRLPGVFNTRLDSSPALGISVPYRQRISDCWSVDVLVTDKKGNTIRRWIAPHWSEFDTRKVNNLMDVKVWTK